MARLLHLSCFEDILAAGNLTFRASNRFSVSLRYYYHFHEYTYHRKEHISCQQNRTKPRSVVGLMRPGTTGTLPQQARCTALTTFFMILAVLCTVLRVSNN